MTALPVILGIDPATHGLGVACASVATGEIVAAHYVPRVQDGWLEVRVRQACEGANTDRFLPVDIVIERVGGGRGVQSMLKVADVAGITAGVMSVVWPDAVIWRPTPGEWKKRAGMSGNAKKDAVMDKALELWSDIDRQDTADAICMAHARWNELAEVAGITTTGVKNG
jgi:Holliday junction resolvasome RuvABC endonuclease subunit